MQFTLVIFAIFAIVGCGTSTSNQSDDSNAHDASESTINSTEELSLIDDTSPLDMFSENAPDRILVRPLDHRRQQPEVENSCNYIFRCEASDAPGFTIQGWVPVGPAANGNHCDIGFRCPTKTELIKSNLLSCNAVNEMMTLSLECVRATVNKVKSAGQTTSGEFFPNAAAKY